MPNVYAQKMIDMMNRTGQPMTTTTTGKSTGTTTIKQPNEGLDLSSIMLMLMMNSMFKNPNKTSLGTTPVPSPTLSGDALRNIVSSAPASYETNPLMTSSAATAMPTGMGGMDLQKLIQILASLKSGGTDRPGYGPFTT